MRARFDRAIGTGESADVLPVFVSAATLTCPLHVPGRGRATARFKRVIRGRQVSTPIGITAVSTHEWI